MPWWIEYSLNFFFCIQLTPPKRLFVVPLVPATIGYPNSFHYEFLLQILLCVVFRPNKVPGINFWCNFSFYYLPKP